MCGDPGKTRLTAPSVMRSVTKAFIAVLVRVDSCPMALLLAHMISGCSVCVHHRCMDAVSLICPVAFRADQVRAAFVRSFASLFYTYRRFMLPASGDRRKAGMVYHFNMDNFLKNVPSENSEYMHMLRETQGNVLK